MSVSNVQIFELTNADDPLNLKTTAHIVLCESLKTESALAVVSKTQVRHIVQKLNLKQQMETQLSNIMIQSPQEFHRFPLTVILDQQSLTAENEKKLSQMSFFLSDPDEKQTVLDHIDKWIATMQYSRTVAEDVKLIADELITNSIFNAPYVDLENSASGPTRNKNSVSIDPLKKPHFFIGQDETRIVVGCHDDYGTLNVKKMIARIQACYDQNPAEVMNFGNGGAGIGSFMVFESCTSFYAAVEVGVQTTICCALPIKMSSVKRKELPKNIHISYQETK